MAVIYDIQIELAKKYNLCGAIRLEVLNRIEKAAITHEQYTDEQFEYWMNCLEAAAGMAQDRIIKSGIYRDLGWFYDSYGNNERAVVFYKKSIETDPKTVFVGEMKDRIKELL